MTAAVHAEFTERTGHRILERYGMTEAGMITSNPYDGERVPGTVGFPLPGVDLRVADSDGHDVGAGETGVVEIRSPGLFAGYWQQPDKTAAEFRADGWFITGDVGSVDHEGRLTLEGRSSDMIISGGYNVYPKEIELVLDAVPGVLESAVIGVPHADFGEAVVAIVVRDGSVEVTDDDLARSLDGVLARFKHPKAYVAADSLPRNAMSKVQKAELRATVRAAAHLTPRCRPADILASSARIGCTPRSRRLSFTAGEREVRNESIRPIHTGESTQCARESFAVVCPSRSVSRSRPPRSSCRRSALPRVPVGRTMVPATTMGKGTTRRCCSSSLTACVRISSNSSARHAPTAAATCPRSPSS